MNNKQPTIPILELSTFEPETKQVPTCGPTSQPEKKQDHPVSTRSTFASIITLVSLSGFLLFKFLPDTSVQDTVNTDTEKNEPIVQETSSGAFSELIQKHEKEKSELLAMQNKMISQIKAESEKKIDQESQAEQIRKEMEARLSKQRADMLLEKKRFAEQLEKEMRARFIAQQAKEENRKTQSEENPTQLVTASIESSNNVETSITKIVEPPAKILAQQENPADIEKQEYQQSLADQKSDSIAKQNAIKEQEQHEIQEKLKKQQAIFIAELKKLARQQKEEVAALETQTNSFSVNSDIQIDALQNSQSLQEDPSVNKLFSLVEKGNITYLQKFLKQGGDPDQLNKIGQPLLVKAAAHDQFIMATELLRAGANVNLPDTIGMSPLMYGTNSGNAGIVELLVSNGADVNYLNPESESALIYASKKGYLEIMDLLIQAGANVNAENNEGRTALYFATQNNDNATTTLLLENGAGQKFLRSEGAIVPNNFIGNSLAANKIPYNYAQRTVVF